MALVMSFRLVSLMIILIVVSSGIGFLSGSAAQHTETSIATSTVSSVVSVVAPVTSTIESTQTEVLPEQTTTVIQEITVTLAVPTPSLQLYAQVTPENLTRDENAMIDAAIYNPTLSIVAVEASPMNNPSEAPCPIMQPIVFSLYSGHYTFSNLSEAVPLSQYNDSSSVLCSSALSQVGYTFLPSSDQAILQSQPPNNLHPPPVSINETETLGGYWAKSPITGKYAFEEFSPGQYTVLVSDDWSQEVLCYFAVL